jgi:hypothetical protein
LGAFDVFGGGFTFEPPFCKRNMYSISKIGLLYYSRVTTSWQPSQVILRMLQINFHQKYT